MLVEPGFFRTELLTPESTSYAEPSIDDYAERTKQTVTAWNGMNGLQGGDPAKLAKALIQLASQDEPPLRWVAGADAVGDRRAEGQGPPRPGRRPPRAVQPRSPTTTPPEPCIGRRGFHRVGRHSPPATTAAIICSSITKCGCRTGLGRWYISFFKAAKKVSAAALSQHTPGAADAGVDAPGACTRCGTRPRCIASIAFTDRLVAAGVDPSVGSVGDAYDSALAETTIGLFKTELIKAEGPWRDQDHVDAASFDRVHWYNTDRSHEVHRRPHPGRRRGTLLPFQSQPRTDRMTQDTESPDISGGFSAWCMSLLRCPRLFGNVQFPRSQGAGGIVLTSLPSVTFQLWSRPSASWGVR